LTVAALCSRTRPFCHAAAALRAYPFTARHGSPRCGYNVLVPFFCGTAILRCARHRVHFRCLPLLLRRVALRRTLHTCCVHANTRYCWHCAPATAAQVIAYCLHAFTRVPFYRHHLPSSSLDRCTRSLRARVYRAGGSACTGYAFRISLLPTFFCLFRFCVLPLPSCACVLTLTLAHTAVYRTLITFRRFCVRRYNYCSDTLPFLTPACVTHYLPSAFRSPFDIPVVAVYPFPCHIILYLLFFPIPSRIPVVCCPAMPRITILFTFRLDSALRFVLQLRTTPFYTACVHSAARAVLCLHALLRCGRAARCAPFARGSVAFLVAVAVHAHNAPRLPCAHLTRAARRVATLPYAPTPPLHGIFHFTAFNTTHCVPRGTHYITVTLLVYVLDYQSPHRAVLYAPALCHARYTGLRVHRMTTHPTVHFHAFLLYMVHTLTYFAFCLFSFNNSNTFIALTPFPPVPHILRT